jgi:hypothetical protein
MPDTPPGLRGSLAPEELEHVLNKLARDGYRQIAGTLEAKQVSLLILKSAV